MGRRGRKRQLAIEDAYWQLIMDGIGTVEACRRVGITRKTGYRWRAERGGLPPLRVAEEERDERYLSLPERQRIAGLCRCGLGVRAIARELGRSPSTVSRELRRNRRPHDVGGYNGGLANHRARERARRPRAGRLSRDAVLRALGKPSWSWSGARRRSLPGCAVSTRIARWHLYHETIYQAVYHGGKHGLTRNLTPRLRTGRPLRKRRRRAQERTTRFVAQGCLIDARPVVVETRSRVGDWEGDLIVGRTSRSAIGTLVDRTSRCLRLIRLPAGHAAENFAAAAAVVLEQLPAQVRLTLTWDQGSEMARHDLLARYFADGIYFAPPGQSMAVDVLGGLLRRHITRRRTGTASALKLTEVVDSRVS